MRLGCAYEIATDSFSALTELTLWCRDRPGLLALIAGACSAAGANIVGAGLGTTRDGMALNTFVCSAAFPDDQEERDFAVRIATRPLALKGEGDFHKMISQKQRTRARSRRSMSSRV